MKRAIKACTVFLLCIVFVVQLFVVAVPVRTVEASTSYSVQVTGSSVNVRKGAGTNYSRIGVAYKGAEYDYLGQKTVKGTVWYQIKYSSSAVGWISGTYSKKVAKSSSTSSSTANTTMSSYIKSVAKSYGADGIQVALIENGVVTETFNYGYATKSSKVMTSDTKIRVASLSKVAVAMMAMKMQEQEIVDINSNISKYWGTTYKKVTLSSLLSHTSTLKSLSTQSTAAKIRTQLKSSSSYISGTAGSSGNWMYNNYAFGVTGSTLEVAAKTTLDKYGDKYFFDSLDADIAWTSGNVDTSKLATLYYAGGSVARSVSKQKTLKGSSTPGSNATYFAGGLTCSAKDYAKLISILANDGTYKGVRYLEESSVELMEQKLFKKSEYGGTFYQCRPLRYASNLYGESGLYYHTGNAYGVLALASYNPTTRNGVVVVTTGASAWRDSQGVYGVCSKITKYAYSYIKSKNTTTNTTTTTVATTETSVYTEATSASTEVTSATDVTLPASTEATSVTETTTASTESTQSTAEAATTSTEATTDATTTTTETTAATTTIETTASTTAATTTVTTAATTTATTAAAKKIKVTGSSVNVRRGAGTSYAILTSVKNGKTYTYTATKKVGSVTWYRIIVNSSITGWICGTYVKKV